MFSGSSDQRNISLRLRQDDKFYRRLLSRESSTGGSTYYCDASGAVPFLWESQPGTPQDPGGRDAPSPPLTPPPSHQCIPRSSPPPPLPTKKTSSWSNHARAILLRLAPKKARVPTSSSSSSFSPTCSPIHHWRLGFWSAGSSPFRPCMGYDGGSEMGCSPTSTLCFGSGRHGGFRGCYKYKMVVVKRALLSVVRHGSGRPTA